MPPIACQIEAVRQVDANFGVRKRWKKTHAQHGFTMVEMVTTMVIVGILAVFAAPHFFDRNTFDSRGFYDQIVSTLRYAQKAAIAQHRFVCVAFVGTNSVVLTQGASAACGGNLANPSNGQAAYSLSSSNASFASIPSAFNPLYFDALGKPSASGVLAVNGLPSASSAITVEAETGYVH